MKHPAAFKGGRTVAGGMIRRFDAASLVNGHIDDDRSRPHCLHHFPGAEHRRPATGDEHRPDEQVGFGTAWATFWGWSKGLRAA